MKAPVILLMLAWLLAPLPALAQAHQHGVARLDVTVEPGTRLTLALETPLDNLVGFERAPRTDAERQRADAAIAKIKDAKAMLRIDPAARCTAEPVAWSAPMLQAGAKARADGHAELEAAYYFACPGAAPAWIELGFFDAFAGLQRLEVQIAGPKRQTKRTLRRPAARIELGGT